jgi:AcrR family transcriptional regulator
MRADRAAVGAGPVAALPLTHGTSSRRHSAAGRPATARKGRGRPRNPRIDREVVSAVLKELRHGGYRAVTLEGIAHRVKRARTSLYRRWPSKRHLVAYSVLSEMGARPAADTGTLRGDLQAAVASLRRAFAGPLRQALPGLVADMAHDAELAAIIREEVLETRRNSMRAAFTRAAARGEARTDLELELLLDMMTGPFYYRALFGHAPISRRMAHDTVEYVLSIAARRA